MLKRVVLYSVLLMLIATSSLADIPLYDWSRSFTCTSAPSGYGASPYDVTTDSFGNVIVAGFFHGTIDCGGDPLASAGARDAFVAKLDRYGNHLWSYSFGDTVGHVAWQQAFHVAVDDSDNIYIAGNFTGSMVIGTDTLFAISSMDDVFLAKFDPSGTYVWSIQYGGWGGNAVHDLWTDGNEPIIGEGFDVARVIRFDSNGNLLWSASVYIPHEDSNPGVSCMAIDDSGNIFVAGGYWVGGPEAPPRSSTQTPEGGNFIALFNASGTNLWTIDYPDPGDISFRDMAIDKNGNAIVTGVYSGTIDFGSGPITSAGMDDMFIAGFDLGGVNVSNRSFGGTDDDESGDIAFDSYNNMYVAGQFNGSIDFGGGSLTSAGYHDVFLLKLDSSGNHVFSDNYGGIYSEYCRGLAVDDLADPVIVGHFGTSIDFGGGPLTNPDDNPDGFVARFVQPGPVTQSIVDVGNDQGRFVRINFARSSWDAAVTPDPILQYEAYRRIDTLPVTTGQSYEIDTEISPMSDQAPVSAGWEYVGAVPAHGESEYNMIVPTLADSTIVNGMHWSAFFIRAATANPLVYYDSDPDSGYSLDNLAPSAPQGLSMSPEQMLSWEPCPETDVDRYSIYGRLSPSASGTGEREFIGNTSDTQYDLNHASFYSTYYVTAVDNAGNEGEPAEYDRMPTGVGQRPAASRVSLSAYPNPFNPRTSITYSVPKTAHVRISIYNVQGQLVKVLVNRTVVEGTHNVPWSGVDYSDREVTSGVYFVRMESSGIIHTQKLILLK